MLTDILTKMANPLRKPHALLWLIKLAVDKQNNELKVAKKKKKLDDYSLLMPKLERIITQLSFVASFSSFFVLFFPSLLLHDWLRFCFETKTEAKKQIVSVKEKTTLDASISSRQTLQIFFFSSWARQTNIHPLQSAVQTSPYTTHSPFPQPCALSFSRVTQRKNKIRKASRQLAKSSLCARIPASCLRKQAEPLSQKLS